MEISLRTIEEIRRVKKTAERQLLHIPGVTGVDVNYKLVGGEKTDRLAIVVYVDRKEDVADDQAIPSEIEGVPTDVVQRRFKIM